MKDAARGALFPNQISGLAAAIGTVQALESPADALMRAFFRHHPQMGRQDRAFISDGVFAYLRRKRSLEMLADTNDPRRRALAIVMRENNASVRELESALRTSESEWLSAFKARQHAVLPPDVQADLPEWLWVKLLDAVGADDRAALALAWQSPAPVDLRVNTLKGTRDEAVAALAADGIEAAPTPWSPVGLRLSGRLPLAQNPLLADGRLEVQDEGSQLIGYLLAPRRGEMVADFCAGAGGKTLMLGALMRSTGRLYAFDVVDKRLANLKPRLARSGLSNVHPQLIASERDVRIKRLAGKLDRVLVDAPCTGFGTLRRNPDLKWRQTEVDLAELVIKQASILASAATLLKPGGRLVYATCSVLPDENEAIVEGFLAAHADFTVIDAAPELARAGIALDTGKYLRLSPHRHGCDGFFGAILQRQK